ncbi:MAG: hypothetical protein ACP5I3_10725 [Thermoproteus sp.]
MRAIVFVIDVYEREEETEDIEELALLEDPSIFEKEEEPAKPIVRAISRSSLSRPYRGENAMISYFIELSFETSRIEDEPHSYLSTGQKSRWDFTADLGLGGFSSVSSSETEKKKERRLDTSAIYLSLYRRPAAKLIDHTRRTGKEPSIRYGELFIRPPDAFGLLF